MSHNYCYCGVTFIFVDATALPGSSVVDGTGQIWLDNVMCRLTDSRLIDCPNFGLGVHNCIQGEDAGVRCAGSI